MFQKNDNIWLRVALGVAAGLAGTMALQTILKAQHKYAPATEPPINQHPGEFMVQQATKVLPEKARQKISDRAKSTTGNLLGLGYGMTFGALYAALRPAGGPSLRDGIWLGLLSWAAGYLGWLPGTKLMPVVWRQKIGQVAVPVAEHALYGMATVAAYDFLHERVEQKREPLAAARRAALAKIREAVGAVREKVGS